MTTLIIPIYNDAQGVPLLLHNLEQYAKTQTCSFEVCIIDDGSTDATRSLLLAEQFPWLRVISLEKNSGKGAAIVAGIAAAHGDHVVFTDADLPYDLEAINAIDEALNQHPVAIGSRSLLESRSAVAIPFKRKIASIVFSRIANFVLLSPIDDTQCGIKGFTRSAAQELFANLQTTRFCFDVEILYRAQKAGYLIASIPVYWKNNGNSSVSLFRDSAAMLRDLFLLYLRTRFFKSHDSPPQTITILGIGFLIALLAIPILTNVGIVATITAQYSFVVATEMVIVWLACVPMLTLFSFKLLRLLPLPTHMTEEGSRYILVGIFNTVLNISIFNILVLLTGIARGTEILVFSLIAYSITIIQAFWWNKYWVFNHAQQPSTLRTYSTFLTITVGTALISSACVYLLTTIIGAPASIPPRLWANISILLVIPLSFLGNFFGNKFFVFKKIKDESR